MASNTGAIWAIDIGNSSLKALHLRDSGGVVEAIGFDNIRHGKILAGSGVTDAERDELIALSLRQFVSNNNIGKDDIIISVPSQNSFARFVTLPPVEAKRIPEIVQFEAAQQIPFDINDVQWDWQLMDEGEGDGENKVGIFAIKNEVADSMLEHFGRENMQISHVQMASMALYNYILHDRPDLTGSDNQATVVLNIGAENTDLVVCTAASVWQRCIPIGGNAFTAAIAGTFKLNFEKAEKLKRTAVMSKYARQILQAMKPVFTDLSSEIQRSLGFYTSSSPDTKIVRLIALGGGTKMRGLLKYLQQSLQIPIEMPDSFKKLAINPEVSAAKFHENVCDFGIVYGLGLQALGFGRIENNLLPRSVARSMTWASKARYFTAAACILVMVSALSLARSLFDKADYGDKAATRQRVSNVINSVRQAGDELESQKGRSSASQAKIKKEFELFKYRDVIPSLHEMLISVLPNEKNYPEQKELYRAFAAGDVETVLRTPRKERKQLFVTSVSVKFADDISATQFGEGRVRSRGRSRRKGGPTSGDREALRRLLGLDVPKSAPARPKRITPSAGAGTTQQDAQGGPGFVVTIEGSSPNRKIGELLDPAGVGDDSGKWGVVTRLLHLADTNDSNNIAFKLFKKADIKHFRLETGPVSLGSDIPAGIGEVENRDLKSGDGRKTTKEILLDPMTKEIISKVAVLNKDGSEKKDKLGKVIYEVNDCWFRLNVKFLWKDAPKKI